MSCIIVMSSSLPFVSYFYLPSLFCYNVNLLPFEWGQQLFSISPYTLTIMEKHVYIFFAFSHCFPLGGACFPRPAVAAFCSPGSRFLVCSCRPLLQITTTGMPLTCPIGHGYYGNCYYMFLGRSKAQLKTILSLNHIYLFFTCFQEHVLGVQSHPEIAKTPGVTLNAPSRRLKLTHWPKKN